MDRGGCGSSRPVDYFERHKRRQAWQARFKTMKNVPTALRDYIAGLKAHDVSKIAATVADDLRFVMPVTTGNKEQFLNFLRALYAAFPDWHYEHDEPALRAG